MGMSNRWHALIQEYISGTISESDAKDLERQLKADPALRDWYLDALNLDSGLAAAVEAAQMSRALPLSPLATTLANTDTRSPARKSSLWAAAVAAVLVLLCGTGVYFGRRGVPLELTAVSEDSSTGWKPGDRLFQRHLTWARGSVQLRLPSGVQVSVDGPADLLVLNPMELRLNAGKVTADVGPNGHGFVIETPEARIEDLGTVFGVDATRAAKTDVVVFSGKVEVLEKGFPDARPVALAQGEGLRLERNRRSSRILNVNGPDAAGTWNAQGSSGTGSLILSVRDSMSADEAEIQKWPSLKNFYRIVPGGLRNGALAFADVDDEWSGVPAELLGADQVRTFAVDRYNWFMKLTLEVGAPADLFVFIDQRNPVPRWVGESFEDTGKTILLDFKPGQAKGRVVQQFPYSVWRRHIPVPGEVTLGAPYEDPPEDRKSFRSNNMFGIAAKRIPSVR
jgi:ferric-dicitrate binding protein FerR (iron transport regulator)